LPIKTHTLHRFFVFRKSDEPNSDKANFFEFTLFNLFDETLNKSLLKSKVVIIGGGFSGLSTACYLAKYGFDVVLYEKNHSLGGRARQFKIDGYTFDMGPSWYWMPDVFERFFADFGHQVSDFYNLQLLDPGFRIFYDDDQIDIPFDPKKLAALFESIEPGAAANLERFLESAKYKYEIGMKDLVYKPGLSIGEFINRSVVTGALKLNLTKSFDRYVAHHFKNRKLQQLMEFPVLFLGAAPSKTPALYSLMNYAGLSLGTWYPQGGMFEIVDAMASLAQKLGVKIHTGSACEAIQIEGKRAKSIKLSDREVKAEYIVTSADYHFSEQRLLSKNYRNYDQSYWDTRVMAPSSLIFYLGVEGKIDHLLHHNLFFDEDLEQHTTEIYETPMWPTKPLFYVCCPSKTDATVAPLDCENLFILMPLSAGLNDTPELRERYFDIMLNRIETRTGVEIRSRIRQKRSYCLKDFIQDYGAFKGNAYGLANTLKQTAIFKPSIKNKKIDNLFYTGHLTVPGPGVPPSIISGKLVADQILKQHNQ
jgi:phytoene desaturase